MANKEKNKKIWDIYFYDRLDLPYSIEIRNSAIEKFDPETGESLGVAIPNLRGFIAAFAIIRTIVANKLLPEEIRFFRKALELKGKEFANSLNVAPETLSRWETGGVNIDEKHERLLRLIVADYFKDKAPQVYWEPKIIMQMGLKATFSKNNPPKFLFEYSKKVQNVDKKWDGWEEAA